MEIEAAFYREKADVEILSYCETKAVAAEAEPAAAGDGTV